MKGALAHIASEHNRKTLADAIAKAQSEKFWNTLFSGSEKVANDRALMAAFVHLLRNVK